jgi:hypothetical protein
MRATSSLTSASPISSISASRWQPTARHGGQGLKRTDPHPEEQAILQAAPEIADYVAALKQHSHKLVVLVLRQLLRLVREYPREPFLSAVQEASRYGLYDLDRLERMILRRVQRDFFRLDEEPGDE